ncbi:unnamed protein product [Pieris brassicae]|uniref:Uncharacterized protein n=1 Tax=Pieris brassicae TaxID=7116 RepID=A0A9P0T4X5_PIEBR|nr:unnamed protein product [Pieris brassicae]
MNLRNAASEPSTNDTSTTSCHVTCDVGVNPQLKYNDSHGNLMDYMSINVEFSRGPIHNVERLNTVALTLPSTFFVDRRLPQKYNKNSAAVVKATRRSATGSGCEPLIVGILSHNGLKIIAIMEHDFTCSVPA